MYVDMGLGNKSWPKMLSACCGTTLHDGQEVQCFFLADGSKSSHHLELRWPGQEVEL